MSAAIAVAAITSAVNTCASAAINSSDTAGPVPPLRTSDLRIALAGFPSGSYLAAQPNLEITANPPDGPGYVLAQQCVPGTAYIKFLLRVTNAGTMTSPALEERTAVTATSAADPSWSTGSPLGALSIGQTVGLTLQLPARAGVQGDVDFKISINSTQYVVGPNFPRSHMLITVHVPAGACPLPPSPSAIRKI